MSQSKLAGFRSWLRWSSILKIRDGLSYETSTAQVQVFEFKVLWAGSNLTLTFLALTWPSPALHLTFTWPGPGPELDNWKLKPESPCTVYRKIRSIMYCFKIVLLKLLQFNVRSIENIPMSFRLFCPRCHLIPLSWSESGHWSRDGNGTSELRWGIHDFGQNFQSLCLPQ